MSALTQAYGETRAALVQANGQLAQLARLGEAMASDMRALRRQQHDGRMRRPGLGNTFVPFSAAL